jgi:hypothetical protein
MKQLRILASFLFLLMLFGCTPDSVPRIRDCRVVLEAGEGFTCSDHTLMVRRGSDATFYVEPMDGYEIIGSDYENTTVSPSYERGFLITLHEVRYPTVVTLTVRKSDAILYYHRNDGTTANPVAVPVTPSHLRWNTATTLFSREGYTLYGWNTLPDGTGTAIGLGSRIDPADGPELYAQWSKWSDPDLFLWEPADGGIAITGYLGNEEIVTVPGKIEGQPVTVIAADALRDAACHTVILPDTLNIIEAGAFRNTRLDRLYLFDNLRLFGDPEAELQTLHINACELPVYSGTYYDTFQDKYDRLLSLKDSKKIVLFSGSSTRFGFDSQLLAEAFPDYEIVNMGVFAYTNALPQLELILQCMKPGDVMIHMPEFDTSDTQFCITTDLDEAFFNMMESNYDTIAKLDMHSYTNIFPMLEAYLNTRETMTKRSYAISAANYDEDGNPVDSPSYNVYGDYIVYRPNPASKFPVYGMPVPYTVAAFPEDPFITSINQVYRRFLDAGVHVYYTYSPRNRLAISEASTPAARAELDAYFREKLLVPIISEIEDSLWSGTYLYGTDNHLSTEGVAIHTRHLIPLIREQMIKDGLIETGD